MTANESTRAKSLALHVSDLMLIMNTNKLAQDPGRLGGAQYSLRHFDRVEPFSLVSTTHIDVPGYFTDGTPWDLDSPLDVIVANRVVRGPRLLNEDFLIRRYRRVKRPYLPLKVLKRYVVEESHLGIDSKSGIARTLSIFWGSNGPADPWVELDPLGYEVIGNASPESQAESRERLGLAVGMQITRDYQWRVHLKYAGAEIGVMIPSTPSGIRELFRLRDCEPGASRRKALAHWVAGHSRRIRKDTPEEDLTWVRDHLRGSRTFKWQDMQGAIHPSTDDLRRLKILGRR